MILNALNKNIDKKNLCIQGLNKDWNYREGIKRDDKKFIKINNLYVFI